jgi:hypothetical protein
MHDVAAAKTCMGKRPETCPIPRLSGPEYPKPNPNDNNYIAQLYRRTDKIAAGGVTREGAAEPAPGNT